MRKKEVAIKMKRILKDEKGNIVIFSVIAMITVMLFASMAIDVGCLLTAKNQIQAAVDAAALAGATGLIVDQTEATNRAITVAGNNTVINQSVQMGAGDIGFPNWNQVAVQATQNVNLFFARVVGMNSANVSATAAAELGTIIGTNGLRPWGVPDLGWTKGTTAVLKAGCLCAPATNPSFYYCICFPPMNRGAPQKGAAAYRYNIIYGSQSEVYIGDVIQVEPGKMVGPTIQGVNELIAQDPYAYWDGREIVNSGFPGTSSPRIVKIPLYNSGDPPHSGRKSITCIGLAAFFLLGMQGKDVMGIFVAKMSNGTFGGGNSMLRGARLIQ
jgi:Flp pilus assembly protein TadG